MSIKRAEKITMWTVLVAIISFIIMRCFHRELYLMIPERTYLFVHSGIEFIDFAVSFTMLVLGWLFFAKSLSKHRLYTAALFSAIGLFDLLHALTAKGMPFYMAAGETTLSSLFAVTGRLFGAVGLFVIFRKADMSIPASRRLPAFIIALGIAATLAVCYFTIADQPSVPVLTGNSIALLRILVHFVIIFSYISTITMVLYLHRTERPQALLTIIQALVFFTIANLQFVLGSDFHDSDLVLAHLYKLAGYYSLMKGIYYVTIYEPFKQQKRTESRINYLAYHDELTGLSNRRLLKEKLDEELALARMNESQLAVFLFDIDRFKNVNDALGHSFGDQMLQAVSERLRYAVGKTNHLFRMGGDEFVMLMPDVKETGDERVEKQAKAIMGLFDAPFLLGDAEYHITISLGISFFPKDGDSVEVLLKNADTAMYSAKAHRNEFSAYVPEMNQKAHDRLRLESDLRKAIEQEQFTLAYQPLVNLSTGKVVGVEALVRWNHPKRGLLPPGDFIHLTEENGLILQLGEWVLRAACKQNVTWQEAGLPAMMMSVNLSMRQFRQHQLAERIKDILVQTGMPPQYLELEITESMTSDVEFAAETLTSLKELGVQISIDDFGTGYSSLVSLKRFPIDKLKIDRSFVGDLSQGGSDAAIVSTITTMAKNLKLKVTAEGVENDEQIQFLRDRNCEEAQGFYFTKPIPANLFENWFRHRSQSA
ncbi:diguanylate cyclase (GGDEF)-like protein [Paenibacillus taihuensis]|uniref:Diguanylate cyclase (GGDEF)-like protein n=1 Tax=Paenibacillus taihuensis TaxID=1156355 RepID=A0A3D9S8E9_9BACL|nr:EAL domain-containing protein [Paenibacillus taihuensis]REE85105.1 diguanylate cyclase (GGDEF)-like protein [Paenibacillus taihuensis]